MQITKLGIIKTTDGQRDHHVEAEDGSRWRVRVRRFAETPPDNPVANGEPDVAPVRTTYLVSLARLEMDGEVARDEEGRLLIGEPMTLTVQPDALGTSVAEALEAVIADRIAHAKRVAERAAEQAAAESEWL